MPTLILTPRYSEDAPALWRAANHLGWKVVRLVNWRLLDDPKLISEPVLHLEALMAEEIASQLGVRLLDAPSDWLPNIPQEYRKCWIYLSSLGEARQLENTAFIKPPNDKSFPVRVSATADLPTDYPDEMLVLVAEIVEWEKEFRCFILNRCLKTFSIYLRNGELQLENDFAHTDEEDFEVRTFIETVIADERVELLQAIVIDIGLIRGRGWAVVESNAAWGAGLYGCDPIQVLEVLRYAISTA